MLPSILLTMEASRGLGLRGLLGLLTLTMHCLSYFGQLAVDLAAVTLASRLGFAMPLPCLATFHNVCCFLPGSKPPDFLLRFVKWPPVLLPLLLSPSLHSPRGIQNKPINTPAKSQYSSAHNPHSRVKMEIFTISYKIP